MIDAMNTAAWQDSRQIEPDKPQRWRGRANAPRRWAVYGGLLGLLLAPAIFAPASWLARGLASASNQHLLLTDTRGSLWSGSGLLVLAGGEGSRDASVLPGRIHWTMGVQGFGLLLRARQECCINGELNLHFAPGWGRYEVALAGERSDWLLRWPAAWAAGLGTPWNTVQLGGSARVSARGFKLEWVQGRWRQFGQLDLDLINLSSRISTVAPLGSYRFSIAADPAAAGVSTLKLTTLDGALLLSGQGSISGGKTRFTGEAWATPGREAALDNFLNIIGRRQGARSIISIG